MIVARRILGPAIVAILVIAPGCFVPTTQYNESLTQNRSLASQNRAQLAEIANLRQRTRDLTDQLARTEEQLARGEAGKTSAGLPSGSSSATLAPPLASQADATLPPEVERKMALLAKRYPALQLDPATGVGKLDTEIMFDSGRSELTPAAASALRELAAILGSPEGGLLKVMVVGHTDDRPPANRGGAREHFPSNFHLSTARAVAVADQLRQAGLPEYRVGVAGFTARAPSDAPASTADRKDDRRVEIFVVAAETPILGWRADARQLR